MKLIHLNEGVRYMTERKIIIIEKAVDLFAVNGFSATSVQDITDACGISKGSFYLSFKSKDNLLLEIFQYFSNKLFKRMSEVNALKIEPEVRLELFYQIYFEEVSRYSNFILMQMRERTKTLDDGILDIITNLRKISYAQQSEIFLTVYGPKIEKHIPDLHVLVNGLITGYMEIIFFNKESLNFPALAKFLVSITDSVVENLNEPFLREEQIIGFGVDLNPLSPSITEILNELQALLDNPFDEDTKTTLEIIEQELRTKEPRKPLISGMLSNLHHVTETSHFVQSLKSYMKSL